MNNDGIVDISYSIDGPLNNYDYFPLVQPYTYYLSNEIFDQNIIFTILEHEILFFYNCSLLEGYKITFQGKGEVRIENSVFYHTVFTQELDIIAINSTLAYSEIFGECTAFFYKTTLQQMFAYDKITGMVLECDIVQLFDGSPIPGAGHSGTMQKASGYSQLIFAPNEGTSRWGAPPAGLICMIKEISHNETDFSLIMEGTVEFLLDIEGFNPNPNNEENITINFYVNSTLYEHRWIISNSSDWNWHQTIELNTSLFEDGSYNLTIEVFDNDASNKIVIPVIIKNEPTTPPPTTTSSISTPSTTTRRSVPALTSGFTVLSFLMGVLVIMTVSRRARR